MGILWCGGEDIDFPNGNVPVVTLTTGYYRSNFARCTLGPSGGIYKSLTFTPITSAWLSARVMLNAAYTSARCVGLAKSGSNSGIFIGSSAASAGKFALSKMDAGVVTELAVEGGTGSFTQTLHRVDLQLISYGATATLNLWCDGVLIITYSGSVALAGISNLDQVWLPNSTSNIYVSEMMLADEDMRGWIGLRTLGPAALGTTNAWSNTAVASVNPTTINDSNATYSNTAAQDNQYNLDNEPSGIFMVKSVVLVARAMHTVGSTADHLNLGFNSGGSVAVGTSQALTTTFATYTQQFDTNPVTMAAWGDAAEINALQIDLRSA